MTDQTTALRDRIADALAEADGWVFAPGFKEGSPTYQGFLKQADAVLAVLPAPVDRTAAPSAAVRKTLRRWAYAAGHIESELNGAVDRMYELVARDVLRRVADETAATATQAHAPLHQWRVEILDGDEWMPASGLRRDRSQAAEQLRMSSERRPLWKDGTQVQRRLVRETTTYTVEAGPGANCSGGVLRTGPGRHLPECPNGTAAGARQDEVWPVKESTRRYAAELRATPGQASADGHTGWECEGGASLLVAASSPGPGTLGTHHGTIYACATHRDTATQRITDAGYEADPQPAPPGHRWNPWPCGHITAHDTAALAALTAAGARQDGADRG